jgi:hypothetical protein
MMNTGERVQPTSVRRDFVLLRRCDASIVIVRRELVSGAVRPIEGLGGHGGRKTQDRNWSRNDEL